MKPDIPATIDDKETYLERYKVRKNIRIVTKKSKGSCPKRIPAEVATAFPPLNPANSGYIWPITAKTPKINGFISRSKESITGKSVAIVPFKISEMVTAKPAFFPNVRKVFVPPRFPLPDRKSVV